MENSIRYSKEIAKSFNHYFVFKRSGAQKNSTSFKTKARKLFKNAVKHLSLPQKHQSNFGMS